MKVSVRDYIAKVNEIYAEKPAYELGHDGSDGKCDCIGMCRGALLRAGATGVTNMRGTNMAARSAITGLKQVSSSGQLKAGDVVLKVRDKDDPSMPLPDRYRKGGTDYDPALGEINFTHIGTVTQTNPLEITHMTSPTAQKDSKLGRWSWAGQLPWVDDEGGGGMQGRVVAQTGSTVNLRKSPSTSAALIDRIPVGSECEILEERGEWDKVVTCGLVGWMMAMYIEKTGGDVQPEPDPDDDVIGDTVTITLTSAEAAAAYPVLAKICEQIAGKIGRG